MASLLYIIHTTKYDNTTKPQAVIQNYFRKHFLELFLGFCKTNLVIYEPIITRMLAAYWRPQNRIKSILIHEYQHMSTRVNTNQHESDTSQHESRVDTSPKQILDKILLKI